MWEPRIVLSAAVIKKRGEKRCSRQFRGRNVNEVF